MSNETESPVSGDLSSASSDESLVSYRSVSRAAIAALILGLASPLAFFSNMLLVLPLLGAIVSLLALGYVTRNNTLVVGKLAALAGLVLSVVAGTAVMSRNVAMQQLVAAQAEPWGVEWCELVRAGELEAALELTRPAADRRPIDQTLRKYYQETAAARETMEKFQSNPLISLLMESSEDDRIVPGESLQVVHDTRGNSVAAHSFFLQTASSERHEFVLELFKAGPKSKIPHTWYIRKFDLQ